MEVLDQKVEAGVCVS